ncbi:DUF1205 domain-containing protein [Solwaraspora sp. WMMD791]|uniref:nucleotide disphospho-sugar-binding domain-containing protein n=1 Tax=Solwaraspora sp. WMMD791 TaxID=3016086 RepID=UPI00249C27A8|nr:nucleotide disphospho-sugar-binding domain-containing protein [Solwaraspora sp. WMMD791]WFE29217.1 DUF1205 domain-containing protein [Solwaraspora sp. WMMD791]
MRVLFTTWAWPSHYFPMVPLAWALRAAGHDVRMTSQPELLPSMDRSGLPTSGVGRDLDIAGVFHRATERIRLDGVPAGRPASQRARTDRITDRLAPEGDPARLSPEFRLLRALEDEMHAVFRAIWVERAQTAPARTSLYGEVADRMVDDLLALARSWRPDLIVFDPLTHAGPVVAALTGVPAVRTLFGPDATYFINVTGLDPLLARFGLESVDLLGAATIDPCPPGLQLSERIAPARRIRTRYIAHNGLSEVPGWVHRRPDRARICLTWGTSIHRLLGERGFLPGEVLAGCAKLAADRGADLMLAITANQRTMLPALPSNVTVVESVPLDALLPSCDALIHQGGAGTMLTALRHGLPQIVLPQILDEGVNGYLLAQAGAGVLRRATEVTAAQLLTDGHLLLDDPGYRQAAQRLRAEMLAQPAPNEIIDDLVALAGATSAGQRPGVAATH